MGRATILENLKEGLYRIQLDYDWTGVDAELYELNARESDYWTRLLAALNTLDDLRRAKSEAADAMSEVIAQWKDALIDKLNEEPPAIEPEDPEDPETGEPWEDADRAQEGPLLDAINAERTAESLDTLTRNADLDQSILLHIRAGAATGRIRHDDDGGWTAIDRARWAGYDADLAIGVGQVQAFGTRTPAATVALWMRRSDDRSMILNSDYTECGVAYVYAPRNPYSYLWGAVFAAPGEPLPTFTPPEPDPAQEAADEAEAAMEKIVLPTIETFEPDKLGAVAAELGKAAQRVRHAERAVAELRVEAWQRDQRKAELEALKAALSIPIHAWCCQFIIDIPEGAVVSTIEVPGFYLTEATPRITTMGIRDTYSTYPVSYVQYDERSINIHPTLSAASAGKLHSVQNMTPAQVFHAAAMEPGAVRWKPLWRYGTLLEITAGDTCTVQLIDATPRQPRGEPDDLILDADDQRTLTAVPIVYPPCNSAVFEEGVDVIIEFVGQSRDAPRVIGFRREPIPCPSRLSWTQLI